MFLICSTSSSLVKGRMDRILGELSAGGTEEVVIHFWQEAAAFPHLDEARIRCLAVNKLLFDTPAQDAHTSNDPACT
jgi:hypothetical protein